MLASVWSEHLGFVSELDVGLHPRADEVAGLPVFGSEAWFELDTKIWAVDWYTLVVASVRPTPSAIPTTVIAKIRAQLLRSTRT